MEKKELGKQNSLKEYGLVPLETSIEHHQSLRYKEHSPDEKEWREYTLIEELGIPYLKTNEKLEPIKWNVSFCERSHIADSQLHSLSLEEIGFYNPFISFCVDLIREAFSSESKQEDDLEIEDSLLHIRAVPFFSDKIVYILIEDRSLQKQFDNLLTYHHQIEAASHIAAGVAHELRNPLSVIKGFLQLSKLTNEFHKYYDTILSELNRMNGIIEDFLSVSRKKVERNRQSPARIMESLIEILKAECLLHNVELTLELADTDQVADVNDSMIKQVMLNLLRNAIEAYSGANASRTLRISSNVEENQYILSVQDNGKGMPESILSQIGKPFFTTKETGTGIGIPLCKRIIEDHGGEFEINSIYNVGTTVMITLPLERM